MYIMYSKKKCHQNMLLFVAGDIKFLLPIKLIQINSFCCIDSGRQFVSASLTHRVTSKQVAVAGTNSKDVGNGSKWVLIDSCDIEPKHFWSNLKKNDIKCQI